MSDPARIRVIGLSAFTRPVTFRLAFRFGAARVAAARQAFVRAEVSDAAGRNGVGWSAEMLMPKWFDKSPDLTARQNDAQLCESLDLAMEALPAAGLGTPFGLHAAVEADHHAACATRGLNGLIASFGLALVDRAIIDAVARIERRPAAALVASNRLGIGPATAPDLAGFDLGRFLATLAVPPEIDIRHTVGLGDALDAADLDRPLHDGLPETLSEVIATYGHRFFKLKLSGDVRADIDRLSRVTALIDRAAGADWRATIDGNEQFEDADHLTGLLDAMAAAPALEPLRARLLFVEQPIQRARALSAPVTGPAARVAIEIDESDADMDAFPVARALGYTGISAKSCKGFYRAILNRARVAQWNGGAPGPHFMSAEDLTTQAGLGIQQDLVLAGLIGAPHVERNGHHFVAGMAGAPEAEQAAYLAHHADLYQAGNGSPRLAIRQGRVALGSVANAAGLGSSVLPDLAAMVPLARAP